MSNTFFQKIYDKIKYWKPPEWLKIMLAELNELFIAILKKAGEAYINYLKQLIIEAAQSNMAPQEKFKYVFKNASKKMPEFAITLRDSELSALIDYLVARFKKEGVIR
jgi:hypothetical protein